jgi:hypothetical protein
MTKIELAGQEFTVDEIVYDGEGVAVYVVDGVLEIDDGTSGEKTEDTPENREKFVTQAKELEKAWER